MPAFLVVVGKGKGKLPGLAAAEANDDGAPFLVGDISLTLARGDKPVNVTVTRKERRGAVVQYDKESSRSVTCCAHY